MPPKQNCPPPWAYTPDLARLGYAISLLIELLKKVPKRVRIGVQSGIALSPSRAISSA